MNGAPHTHKVKVSTEGFGWRVTYGDQTERYWYKMTEERLQRAVARLVRRHDAESRKAQAREDLKASASTILNSEASGVWGEEVLVGEAELPKPPPPPRPSYALRLSLNEDLVITGAARHGHYGSQYYEPDGQGGLRLVSSR